MSKHVKHVPKHRGAPTRSGLVEAPRKAVRKGVVFSSVAVAATGVVVSGGVLGASPAAVTSAVDDNLSLDTITPDAQLAAAAAAPEVEARSRSQVLSRSADRRAIEDPVKEASLTEPERGEVQALTDSVDLAESDPRNIAKALLGDFGFSQDQFGCLDSLYTRESGWSTTADNPSSSAYGIPQSLPGSKMASAGADWETNPVTQITWGLGYIQDRYGSPCGAWAHSEAVGWY